MTWTIKPSIGNVLVQPQKEESLTRSGIILVAPAVEKESHIAEVVGVCEPYSSAVTDKGTVQDGPIYSIGTLVIIGKYNGRNIKIRQRPGEPHEEYIIIRESDVLGTLEEEPINDPAPAVEPKSPD